MRNQFEVYSALLIIYGSRSVCLIARITETTTSRQHICRHLLWNLDNKFIAECFMFCNPLKNESELVCCHHHLEHFVIEVNSS